MICSTDVAVGRNTTVANLSSKLTFPSTTPSMSVSLSVMRLEHDVQDIPDTSNVALLMVAGTGATGSDNS